MPDFYSQQYENAGPLARPVIQRSQYLADALRSMRESETPINNGGQLAARLLAQAIGQYAQRRQEARLRNVTEKDQAAALAPYQAMIDGLRGAQGDPSAVGMGSGISPTGAGSPAIPALAEAPTPTQPMAQAPVDPLYNYHAKTDDLAARLLSREAPPGPGQVAVGNVIRNRGAAGMDLADVMTQRSQFEPLSNPQTRAEIMSMPTTDPRYRAAMDAWRQSATQQVAPAGANHFYGPQAQRQLSLRDGRPTVPEFARDGGGTNIGGNEFFARPWSPPSDYQMTPPVPMDQAQPAPAPTPPATGGGAPPAGPMPSTGQAGGSPPQHGNPIPSIRGAASIPREQLTLAEQLIANPQTRAQGQQMIVQLVQQAYSRPDLHAQYDAQRGVMVFSDPQGNSYVQPIQGLPPLMETFEVGGVRYQRRVGSNDTPEMVQLPTSGQTRYVQGGQPGAPPGSQPNVSYAINPQTGQATPVETGVQAGYAPGPSAGGPPPGAGVWQPGQPQPGKGGAPQPTQGAPNGVRFVPGSGPAIEAAGRLRTEITPQLATFNTARVAYQRIQSAAQEAATAAANGRSQGPADITIITNYMKLLDPGSSVREGEFATAQNSGSVPESVRAMYNHLVSGGTLTPEQRRSFVSGALAQYGPYEQQYQQLRQRYGEIAGRQGLDPRDIVPDYPSLMPHPSATRPAPQPAPTGLHVGSQPRQTPPSGNVGVGASNPGPRVTGRPRRVG